MGMHLVWTFNEEHLSVAVHVHCSLVFKLGEPFGFPQLHFPTHPRHMLVRELGPLFLLTSLSSDSYCEGVERTACAELVFEF